MPMIEVSCWDSRKYTFNPCHTALVVIDMQRDFLATDGHISSKYRTVAKLAAIVPKTISVLEAARQAHLRIIHTREGYNADGSDVNSYKRQLGYVGQPGPNGPFLIRGTPGHDFFEGFEPEHDEIVIDKPGFSAFYRTSFEEILDENQITHLVIVGITTQCCVHSTLRDAVERGYFCLTLEDCCAAEDPAVHAATLTVIQAEKHLFGWISSMRAFTNALLCAPNNTQ